MTQDEFTHLQDVGFGPGCGRIFAQRIHQITNEGYTAIHDAQLHPEALLRAAISYAAAASSDHQVRELGIRLWPWDVEQFKPRDQACNCAKAGALLAAHIDRVANPYPYPSETQVNQIVLNSIAQPTSGPLEPEVCAMCGASAELRPYGPGGAWVCYPCAMKDRGEAERQRDARRRLHGGNNAH